MPRHKPPANVRDLVVPKKVRVRQRNQRQTETHLNRQTAAREKASFRRSQLYDISNPRAKLAGRKAGTQPMGAANEAVAEISS